MAVEAQAPRLELVAITKSFAGTRALDGVSLALHAGEVHVVAGENGAGKSTLIRVIAGAHAEYSGEMRLDGRPVRFASPAAAVAAGIATIHQELSLVPALSIADNLELRRAGAAFALHARHAANERARKALARVGLSLEPETLVEKLSVAERQLVEIARALAGEVRVLVLDEPTSALPEPDVERLLGLVTELKTQGIACVYISHRLNEIFRLADRISVLRDGRLVFTRNAAEITRDALVSAMVGEGAESAKSAVPGKDASGTVNSASSRGPATVAARLRVRGLDCAPPSALRQLDFELGVGETLGVAGVEGSGASTLLHALFGDVQRVRGELLLDGAPYAPADPRAALARGVALLAGDRHESVLSELSVLENATLSSLSVFSPSGFLRPDLEQAAVAPETQRVKLRAASLDALAGSLSGGNQQKVALVRCLLDRPRLLLLDDPTRGIDVGARADVHALFAELAAQGMSILFRSSDLAELCALADRVLVLFDGRLVATLGRAELSESRLLSLMMGAAA
jgi:ABC-type sugar transport system ATPase subunit